MEEGREGKVLLQYCLVWLTSCLSSLRQFYISNISKIIISNPCISNLFGLFCSLRSFSLSILLLLMIIIQRNIIADISNIIINTALATAALIMIIIDEVSAGFDCVFDSLTDDDVTDEIPVTDDVVGVVGVVGVVVGLGDCVVELMTEDVISRERERGAWSMLVMIITR